MPLLEASVYQSGFMTALLVLVSLAMMAGGIRILFKWPRGKPGGFIVGGTMILLASVTALVVIAFRVTEGYAAPWVVLLVPFSWAAWFVLAIVAGLYIHLTKREMAQQEHQVAHQDFDASRNPARPPSTGPEHAESEVPAAEAADPPMIARCASCMGRWKTTRRVADALTACPKCGASPPQLRLQQAG